MVVRSIVGPWSELSVIFEAGVMTLQGNELEVGPTHP